MIFLLDYLILAQLIVLYKIVSWNAKAHIMLSSLFLFLSIYIIIFNKKLLLFPFLSLKILTAGIFRSRKYPQR